MSRVIQFKLPKRRAAPDINERVRNTHRFIIDAVTHPSQPDDDFIVERAKKLLRYG